MGKHSTEVGLWVQAGFPGGGGQERPKAWMKGGGKGCPVGWGCGVQSQRARGGPASCPGSSETLRSLCLQSPFTRNWWSGHLGVPLLSQDNPRQSRATGHAGSCPQATEVRGGQGAGRDLLSSSHTRPASGRRLLTGRIFTHDGIITGRVKKTLKLTELQIMEKWSPGVLQRPQSSHWLRSF